MGSDAAGYDGQFCEGDRDDCVQQPCGEEAECVDHPAPMVGVTCVCPEGFNITEDGTRCLGTCAGHGYQHATSCVCVLLLHTVVSLILVVVEEMHL